MLEPPDAYDELRQLAQSLEARGVRTSQVIDALFRLTINAAIRVAGREAVAESLRDMSDLVVAEQLDAKSRETPPTAH